MPPKLSAAAQMDARFADLSAAQAVRDAAQAAINAQVLQLIQNQQAQQANALQPLLQANVPQPPPPRVGGARGRCPERPGSAPHSSPGSGGQPLPSPHRGRRRRGGGGAVQQGALVPLPPPGVGAVGAGHPGGVPAQAAVAGLAPVPAPVQAVVQAAPLPPPGAGVGAVGAGHPGGVPAQAAVAGLAPVQAVVQAAPPPPPGAGVGVVGAGHPGGAPVIRDVNRAHAVNKCRRRLLDLSGRFDDTDDRPNVLADGPFSLWFERERALGSNVIGHDGHTDTITLEEGYLVATPTPTGVFAVRELLEKIYLGKGYNMLLHNIPSNIIHAALEGRYATSHVPPSAPFVSLRQIAKGLISVTDAGFKGTSPAVLESNLFAASIALSPTAVTRESLATYVLRPTNLTIKSLADRHFRGVSTKLQVQILAALVDVTLNVTGVVSRGMLGGGWPALYSNQENLTGVSVPNLLNTLAAACGDGIETGDRAVFIQSTAETAVGDIFSIFLDPSADLSRPAQLLFDARLVVDKAAEMIRSANDMQVAAAVAIYLAAENRFFSPATEESGGEGSDNRGRGHGGGNDKKRGASPTSSGQDDSKKVWPATGSTKPTGLPGFRAFQQATQWVAIRHLRESGKKFILPAGSPGLCLHYHNSMACERGEKGTCAFLHEVPQALQAGVRSTAALIIAGIN